MGAVAVQGASMWTAAHDGSLGVWTVGYPQANPYPDQEPVPPMIRSQFTREKITIHNWAHKEAVCNCNQWDQDYPDLPNRAMIKITDDHYEFGAITAQLMDAHELEDTDRFCAYYKDAMSDTPHSHYIATCDAFGGPVILSIQ